MPNNSAKNIVTRFRVALVLDEKRSVRDWAEEHNVTPDHVYHVLEGRRVSDRIVTCMEIYTDDVFARKNVTIGGDGGSAKA